ncbi:MAG: adenosylcobinamide-GDP ribazoletransferase [Gammaproteobacteria bacterium]|nr:adenosylcobinamide-GDP ribazoletransferase [Gammaproteobacteria bacterium]
MSPIKRELWRLVLALGLLTRLPLPPHPAYSDGEFSASARYYPLVGALLGSLLWGCGTLLQGLGYPSLLVATLVVVMAVMITGALHEDGLADCADGLGGGLDPAARLRIMKDSRIGAYGALALMLSQLLRVVAIAALPALWLLMVAHGLSRAMAVVLMACLPYARDEADAKLKPVAQRANGVTLVVALGFGLGLLLLLPPVTAAAAIVGLALLLWWWRSRLKQLIGGYTGDALGAMQQLSELLFYLVVLAHWGQPWWN